MALEDIIALKLKRLDEVPDALDNSALKAQRQVFTSILELLDKLEREGGLITVSSSNNVVIQEIVAALDRVLINGQYGKAVQAFAGEFPKQALLNNEFIKAAFDGIPDFTKLDLILNTTRKQAVDLLVGTKLQTDFVKPIQVLLEDAVVSGASWTKTVSQIQAFVDGNPGIANEAKLLKHAKQISRDAFFGSDASYTHEAAEDLGIEFFRYSGGTILDTRLFCSDRNGKYYHKNEIQDWGRGLKVGRAGNPWQGKNPSTNAQTIFQLRGGFNCMHSLLPTSSISVPKSQLNRAIERGYFKPGAKERALLKL